MQQAAIQMLAQWQKLQQSGISMRQAVTFFACRVNPDQSHSRSKPSYELLPDLRHMPPLLREVFLHKRGSIWTPNLPLSGPSDVILMWTAPVALQDECQLTTIKTKGLWEHLGMDKGWNVEEELS